MEDRSCPLPTQDVTVNLKNRNYAFEHFGYGPPNPAEPNKVFWLKKAIMYNVTEQEAQTMRCGNCSAFIQTTQMLECIKQGLEKSADMEGGYDEEMIASANLGFCELFAFKCAAERTCDAWLVGGPMDDARYEEVDKELEMRDNSEQD
jgi:hypothetical protein